MNKQVFLFLLLFSTLIFSQSISREQQSLLSLSTISVTIGGTFPLTGSFSALITERVDQFITRIYNEAVSRSLSNAQDEEFFEKIKDDLSKYSLRGIILKRSTGEEIKLDLEKFRLYGDFNYNPYLKNDDVLIFPPYDIERNFFVIKGAVNRPGKYFFVEGDKLSDAIELAMGINPAFENVKEVFISRLSYDGQRSEIVKIQLPNDTELKRGDQIVVEANETQKRDFYVLVLGEVNRPGYVPITKSNTKLGDVIKLVKGFTENASLKRARLFRGNSITPLLERQYGIKIGDEIVNKNKELVDRIVNYEQAMMFRMSNLVEEDKYYFETENQYRVLNEGSAIDFSQIENENSEINNFILEKGDVIVVPPLTRTVYVFGQVSNPGHVKFVEHEDYLYYISQAGGVGEYAEDEIMIIKGDSRNWIPATTKIQIDDGDFIFVPKQRIKSFQTTITEWGGYFSIIGSIATILLLIFQITK
ncbi:MAG: SLBB domain-containing protein [Ignavibacteriales bacterium]|nr:SLBB domain-containing protein [Ignavibacterium sp.]MCZ2268810.1 SLBB domain-containing protein [Ignavibacteriales bacterium]HMN18857.1 SLBB domain-containing protein [Ignavibacteriaceae bacterium]